MSALVVYRFYCMVLFHSQTRRHMIKDNVFLKGDSNPIISMFYQKELYEQ